MKAFLLISAFCTFSIATYAHAAEQACGTQAREALAMNASRSAENTETIKTFTFIQGAMIGDAGNAIEIDLYKSAAGILWKVELDAEMCTIRNIEYIGH